LEIGLLPTRIYRPGQGIFPAITCRFTHSGRNSHRSQIIAAQFFNADPEKKKDSHMAVLSN
jgi:hypothetical protein